MGIAEDVSLGKKALRPKKLTDGLKFSVHDKPINLFTPVTRITLTTTRKERRVEGLDAPDFKVSSLFHSHALFQCLCPR